MGLNAFKQFKERQEDCKVGRTEGREQKLESEREREDLGALMSFLLFLLFVLCLLFFKLS